MMKITLAFLILTLTSFAYAQIESKCFQANSLRGGHTVTFKTNGNKISGTFTVESSDDETVKNYEFSETLAVNVLQVKFDKNVLPDQTPSSELKSLFNHYWFKFQTSKKGMWFLATHLLF